MRHSARALVDRAFAPERVRLSMERNMKCGVGLCGHCQLRELFCCLDGPVLGYDRLAALMAGRSCEMSQRTTETSAPRAGPPARARGLEVRLLRRLPADPAQLRGRADPARRRGPDRLLPRGHPRRRRGPLRRLPRRGVGHHARRTSSGSSRSGQSPGGWSPSAPAPPAAGSRRCATSPTSPSSARSSTPTRSTSRRSTRSTPIAAHVTVDFELRGCPIDKRQLLEVLAAELQGRAPRIPSHSVCVECKRRGNVCVDRRARHPLPRPGHPGRLRRALPDASPAAATAASGRRTPRTPPRSPSGCATSG